ncbi:MAG TPA: vitamin K epoxide reductase family protein [Candidatus Saccharimonadales bacterium]|nr:vitamin K epoxide reductase family protein [Candidatus Saccharimonadales bacterium]
MGKTPAKTKSTATKPAAPPAAQKLPSFQKVLPWILVVGGIIGLICSFIIAFDEFKLLQNPTFRPNCDLNPIISCGSVMQSKQAHAFGFPNPWIGLMAFPVLICVGAVLLSGVRITKRWFWLGLEAGTVFGLAFVHWLFFETVYRIHALCPYCMVVWVVTITTFWYVTLCNIEAGNGKLTGGVAKLGNFVRRHHLDILVLWFLVIAALILKHFWYYYGRNFHI